MVRRCALPGETGEGLAGGIQFSDLLVECSDPVLCNVPRASSILRPVQLKQLADFLERESSGLSPTNEAQAPDVDDAVAPDAATPVGLIQQPAALVEAHGLDAHLRGSAKLRNRQALTLYHGTDAIWPPASTQGRGFVTKAASRSTHSSKAVIYRMVTPEHVCPWGLKAVDLLERSGFEVEDHHLRSRAATDAFKARHDVATTPQVFVDDQRIGGYDDLRRFLGKSVADPNATSYRPVVALFVTTALLAAAAACAADGHVSAARAVPWFISFSMTVLALLKLQNVGAFSAMFLNYDLLARRWVPYSYVYPFAEAAAGLLMTAGILHWLSIPIALFIGTVGAVSVFKAVYVDRRELKCACVGGSGNVPLGFVSLTENLMMIGMALWMAAA